MDIFKTSQWKWWELKLIGWGGIFFGFALGSSYGEYLENWMWLVWILFAVIWLYIMYAWLKKAKE